MSWRNSRFPVQRTMSIGVSMKRFGVMVLTGLVCSGWGMLCVRASAEIAGRELYKKGRDD